MTYIDVDRMESFNNPKRNVSDRERQEKRLWFALDQQLVSCGRTIEEFNSPEEALNYLVHFHMEVAVDPRVNGGMELVPVQIPIMQAWVEYQQNTTGRSARLRRKW